MAPLPEENGGVQTSTFVNISQPAVAGSSLNVRKQSCTSTRKFENFEDRLRSYDSWPVDFISKEILAAAGFYYLNKDDHVKCPFCDLELGSWERGDDPMKDHKRWAPSCIFVKAVNAAKGNEICKINLRRSNDVCGYSDLQVRPFSCPEQGLNTEKFGIKNFNASKHPQYSLIHKRLQTFDEWPKSLQPKPEKLAEAGFWYSGKSDETICFQCGGGLRDWDPSDDPLVEHSKWYPDCLFVQLHKKDISAENSSEVELLIASKEIENLNISAVEAKEATQMTQKSSSLEAEHSVSSSTSIEDSRLCKVCFQEELGVVTLPCSHLVTCVKCAPSLSTCPVCRKPFTALVRVYL